MSGGSLHRCEDGGRPRGCGEASTPTPGPHCALRPPLSWCHCLRRIPVLASVSCPGRGSALLFFAPPAPSKGQRAKGLGEKRARQDKKEKVQEGGGRRKCKKRQAERGPMWGPGSRLSGAERGSPGEVKTRIGPLSSVPLSQCWLQIVLFPWGLCSHTALGVGSPVNLGHRGQLSLLHVLPQGPCPHRMFHPAGLPPVLTAVPAAEGSGPTNLAHSTVQGTRTQLPKSSRSAWPWTEGLGRDLTSPYLPAPRLRLSSRSRLRVVWALLGGPVLDSAQLTLASQTQPAPERSRTPPYSSPGLCSSPEHSLLSSMIASIRWEDASLVLASGTQTMVV